jgi:hypothetical protein
MNCLHSQWDAVRIWSTLTSAGDRSEIFVTCRTREVENHADLFDQSIPRLRAWLRYNPLPCSFEFDHFCFARHRHATRCPLGRACVFFEIFPDLVPDLPGSGESTPMPGHRGFRGLCSMPPRRRPGRHSVPGRGRYGPASPRPAKPRASNLPRCSTSLPHALRPVAATSAAKKRVP